MNIQNVSFVRSSELFSQICEKFNLEKEDFYTDFSDSSDISYGDASFTLIGWWAMEKTLMKMLEEKQIEEIKNLIPSGVMIDLES